MKAEVLKVTELKCEFSTSNIIFEIMKGDTLSVDATDFKNSKLVYEIRGTRLILFNKNLKFKMKKDLIWMINLLKIQPFIYIFP